MRLVVRIIGKKIVRISLLHRRKTLSLLRNLRWLHVNPIRRVIMSAVVRKIMRHVRGYLLVEVALIEIHTVMLVVVNLSSLMVACLSLLRT